MARRTGAAPPSPLKHHQGEESASSLMRDLHAKPGHLIRRVQQLSSALFAEECAVFDLTSVQYAALERVASW